MTDHLSHCSEAGPADEDAGRQAAYEIVNRSGTAKLLLICDHASNALPKAYRNLGLDEAMLRCHIAFDIGAAEVTRRLSAELDAPAVLAGYSRLLIDCNRELGHETSIAEVSDGVAVPGNSEVTREEARRREDRYFRPYQDAIAALLDDFAERAVAPALIAIHSFTPILGGVVRPWQIGILWRRDPRLARPLLESLRTRPSVCVGDNEPYSGREHYGYSIDTHGARAGLPHVLVEIRQDLIDTRHGAEDWADLLASALGPILSDSGLFRLAHY